MASKKQIRALLLKHAGTELDPTMGEHGFERRRNSLTYLRRCPECEQEIDVAFEYRPTYEPGAEAHLQAWFAARFGAISEVSLHMAGGDRWLLADAPELTFRHTIAFAAPKERQESWFICQPSDARGKLRALAAFCTDWVFPLLDTYSTAHGIVSGYETGDKRAFYQEHEYVRVAAAYLLLGQPQKAMGVLEDRLGDLGPRRRWASAFEHVRARLDSCQQDDSG